MQWLYSLAAVALRVVLGSAIAVGLLQRMDPFPMVWIASWQRSLDPARYIFPGSETYFWLADQWMELSVAIVLIQLSRITMAIRRTEVS